MASDTVPTKPRNGPEAASRSRFVPPQCRRRRYCRRRPDGRPRARSSVRRRRRSSPAVAALDRFRFENRVLDVEIPAVESRPRLGPHLQDQLDRFLHLPDARRRPRRELPAILLVFILEKAGADAERQSSRADQIDARRDLGEMGRIAITDRRGQSCQTDAARDSSQPRQDGPAFQQARS
jgi:hypothetical protein